jgi:hypothetical protein
MELIIYYNIIYNGIIKHPSFLATYFYRESKIAESNRVTKEEFFKRLEDASELFKENMNQQYLDQLLIDVLVQQKRDKELLIGENVIGSQFSSPYSSRPPIYYSDTWGVLGCNLLMDIDNAIQDAKKQGTSAVGISIIGDEEYLLDVSKIIKSHKKFNGELFKEMNFNNYLSCFDIKNSYPIHPEFTKGKEINFIYFLSHIEDIKVNEKIVSERFGLKNYRSRKRTAKPDTVFVNQVRSILK